MGLAEWIGEHVTAEVAEPTNESVSAMRLAESAAAHPVVICASSNDVNNVGIPDVRTAQEKDCLQSETRINESGVSKEEGQYAPTDDHGLHRKYNFDDNGPDPFIPGPEVYHRFYWTCMELKSELIRLDSSLRTIGSSGLGIQAVVSVKSRLQKLRDLYGTNTSWLFPEENMLKSYSPRNSCLYLRDFSTSFHDFGVALDELARAIYNFNNLYHDEKLMLQLFSLQCRFKAEANGVRFESGANPHELGSDIQTLLETWVEGAISSLVGAVKTFTEKGVPAISNAQNYASSGYLTLTTIAFFLSGTTASMLQVAVNENSNASGVAANTFLFSSLVFSIASAVSSLLVLGWHKSVVRVPDGSLPLWLKAWMSVGPMISLLVAGAFFSVALCLFVFASGQHTVTSAITILFSGLHASGLLFISGYFLLQRWHFRQHAGAIGKELTKDSILLPMLEWWKSQFESLRITINPRSHSATLHGLPEVYSELASKETSAMASATSEKSTDSEMARSDSSVVWHALSDEKFILGSLFVRTPASRYPANGAHGAGAFSPPARKEAVDVLSCEERTRRRPRASRSDVSRRSLSSARIHPPTVQDVFESAPLFSGFMGTKNILPAKKVTAERPDDVVLRRPRSWAHTTRISKEQSGFPTGEEVSAKGRSRSHPPAMKTIDSSETSSYITVSTLSDAFILWDAWRAGSSSLARQVPAAGAFWTDEVSVEEDRSIPRRESDTTSIVPDLIAMGEEDFKSAYGEELFYEVMRRYCTESIHDANPSAFDYGRRNNWLGDVCEGGPSSRGNREEQDQRLGKPSSYPSLRCPSPIPEMRYWCPSPSPRPQTPQPAVVMSSQVDGISPPSSRPRSGSGIQIRRIQILSPQERSRSRYRSPSRSVSRRSSPVEARQRPTRFASPWPGQEHMPGPDRQPRFNMAPPAPHLRDPFALQPQIGTVQAAAMFLPGQVDPPTHRGRLRRRTNIGPQPREAD